MNFICYNYSPVLADHVIDCSSSDYKTYGITPLHHYPKLSTITYGQKIFVKTDLLDEFFNNEFRQIKVPFYLITGVSDYEIDTKYLTYLNDDRIIKWLGVNISIKNHPKVIKMLIGFAEPDRKRNGTAEGISGDQELLLQMHNSKKEFHEKIDKLFITYFNPTHSSRADIHSMFKDADYVEYGSQVDFETYLSKINDYKFVLCPRGNGLDTLRFCEILLMGSVPIVERNGIDDLYAKFPCIIVNSFKEINNKLLESFKFDNEKYTVFETHLTLKHNYFT